eukprot:14954487-Alexandrium_andersonii.AAC.1
MEELRFMDVDNSPDLRPIALRESPSIGQLIRNIVADAVFSADEAFSDVLRAQVRTKLDDGKRPRAPGEETFRDNGPK